MIVCYQICAAACLGQDSFEKEIFNLDKMYSWLNKGQIKIKIKILPTTKALMELESLCGVVRYNGHMFQ